MKFLALAASIGIGGLLSGCMASTYVSSIGMRTQHAEVVEIEGGTKSLDIYESKMEPVGGPCSSYVPYVSLVPGKSATLIERREFNGEADLPKKEYRKWYGYPAQSLQLIALPVDVAIDSALLAGGLVAMPFFYIKEAMSDKKAKASESAATPSVQ